MDPPWQESLASEPCWVPGSKTLWTQPVVRDQLRIHHHHDPVPWGSLHHTQTQFTKKLLEGHLGHVIDRMLVSSPNSYTEVLILSVMLLGGGASER